MKKMKYILVLVLLISGCEDMKMDRKVAKNSEIQSQSGSVDPCTDPQICLLIYANTVNNDPLNTRLKVKSKIPNT